MIKLLTYDGNCVLVHAGDTSLKTTKAFTHGSIVFDTATQNAVFGQLEAVPIPEGVTLADGVKLDFQLVAPDGALRKQTRSGILRANEKQPYLLRIAGMAKTPRNFPAEEGWSNEIYKYRAYFTHPGMLGQEGEKFIPKRELPEWLQGCINRQTELWNRLAWLCREARRKCSPVATKEIVAFVQETILPEIDAFNTSLTDRGWTRALAKEKMKHPAWLKIEMPGVDGLWRFIGELRSRIGKGRLVPDGLLEKTVAFAKQFVPDYGPLNEFFRDFARIAEGEACALNLRRFEIRPTVDAFKSALKRRKSKGDDWSEGWPLIKYPDRPKSEDWGVHYYLNKAGVDAGLLESERGIGGLVFAPAYKPAATGPRKTDAHFRVRDGVAQVGVWSRRALREVAISVPGDNDTPWRLSFGVLQHRALPENSHIKEWKLLCQERKLWLCLVIELKRPLPVFTPLVAGLDIGWRRTDEGIRFGTLYEPATKTVRELVVDLQKSPKDHKDRTPFRIDLGPGRWQKRNMTRLFPGWKPGDPVPNLLETRMDLQRRRDYGKDTAKIQLRKHLGERAPTWLHKAGRTGLIKLLNEFKADETVQAILNPWLRNDERLGGLLDSCVGHTTPALEYGQMQIAHDVCRYLKERGIGRIAVESNFLAKLSQRHDNEDPVSLKRSQKYRQFVAVGRFVVKLTNTAAKYQMAIEYVEAINTTRICQHCDFLNAATEQEQYPCAGCGRQIKQDHNAAVNLARFAADPKLAEMAVQAGRESKTAG